jgi:hypothetical protein
MTEFEPGSATKGVAAPTMTYGLNDMGEVPDEARRPPPQPRPLPPNHDIIALLRNPVLAARFDQKWGEGVASKILDTYRLAQSSNAAGEVTSDPPAPLGNVPQVEADDSASNESAQAAAAFEAGAFRLRRTAARHIAPPDKTYDVTPDQLPSDVDPNLAGQVPGLLERLKLNAHDSKFRGGALGSAYLAAVSEEATQTNRLALPVDVARRRAARQAVQEEIFANLVRYDVMDPFGTAAEGVASLVGQFAGSFTSPEGLAGIPARGANVAARIGRAMWQQGLIDAASDAFVQFQSIKSGVQKDHDWWRTAFAFALGTGTGALGRTAVEGAGKNSGSSHGPRPTHDTAMRGTDDRTSPARGAGAGPFEGKSGIHVYDPPARPQRPFKDDYPSRAPVDETGMLLADIEGRPLVARFVIGRIVDGIDDMALPPESYGTLSRLLAGKVPERVPASYLEKEHRKKGVVAAVTFDRSTGRVRKFQISADLNPEDALRAYVHELGHIIERIAGEIPTGGLLDELKGVYSALQNPRRGPGGTEAAEGNFYTPEKRHYKGRDVLREYVAEAIRAYLTNPNYLKTVAPKTAAAIRAAVNGHPRLSRILQFNTVGTLGVLRLMDINATGEDPRDSDRL